MIDVSVKGVAEVSRVFDLFPTKIRVKLVKRAMSAALEPMAQAARAMIGGSGILRGAIDTRISAKGSKGELVRGYIGPRRGIKVAVAVHKGGLGLPPFVAIPTRYAHLVEFGHKIVDKNGKVLGTVAPKPFMRVAWANYGGDVALATFARVLEEGIAAEPI